MNRYETWLIERINNINDFRYDDIKTLDRYPVAISKQVLKVLIEDSCLGQNYGPIELARKKIGEIEKKWLSQNMYDVSVQCIDFSDEWEYRRLIELVALVVPELLNDFLIIGENSDNEEVREVVEDYRNGIM